MTCGFSVPGFRGRAPCSTVSFETSWCCAYLGFGYVRSLDLARSSVPRPEATASTRIVRAARPRARQGPGRDDHQPGQQHEQRPHGLHAPDRLPRTVVMCASACVAPDPPTCTAPVPPACAHTMPCCALGGRIHLPWEVVTPWVVKGGKGSCQGFLSD